MIFVCLFLLTLPATFFSLAFLESVLRFQHELKMQLSISSIGSVILTYLSYCSAFKITKFEVPSEVRIGSTAKLVCEYELAPYRQLYTLRWLRNNVEFYRYDPALTPRHNYYKTHGLHVNVFDNNVCMIIP
jgi:hypothetical protein